jgi:osmotically-inducible protein OsmY
MGVVCLMAAASLVACTRASESAPRATGSAGGAVDDDVKGVAKATEKAAKDIGQATVDLGEKAGVSGQDAWITTKVKSELTSDGFDPVSVHVDTDSKAVTLSGTVESATKARRAVEVAKAVNGVVAVKDHLFVKPAP